MNWPPQGLKVQVIIAYCKLDTFTFRLSLCLEFYITVVTRLCFCFSYYRRYFGLLPFETCFCILIFFSHITLIQDNIFGPLSKKVLWAIRLLDMFFVVYKFYHYETYYYIKHMIIFTSYEPSSFHLALQAGHTCLWGFNFTP